MGFPPAIEVAALVGYDDKNKCFDFTPAMTLTVMVPESVYLTAFVRRLIIICLSLISSPKSFDGISGSFSRSFTVSRISGISLNERNHGIYSHVILPAYDFLSMTS